MQQQPKVIRVEVQREDLSGSTCASMGHPITRALKRRGKKVHYTTGDSAFVDGQFYNLSPALRAVAKAWYDGTLNTPQSSVQLPVKGLLRVAA